MDSKNYPHILRILLYRGLLYNPYVSACSVKLFNLCFKIAYSFKQESPVNHNFRCKQRNHKTDQSI